MAVEVLRGATGATADVGTRDYFISRSGPDHAHAKRIGEILRSAGSTTWLQDDDFGHASFMTRMEQGFAMLDGGARLICLLSATYQKSAHCQKEYNVALAGDQGNSIHDFISTLIAAFGRAA